MDRAKTLAWRLAVPLLALALAAVPWLRMRATAPSAAGDLPPIRLYRCNATSDESAQPGLFAPAQAARHLLPVVEQIPLVVTTQYTSETVPPGKVGEIKQPELAELNEAVVKPPALSSAGSTLSAAKLYENLPPENPRSSDSTKQNRGGKPAATENVLRSPRNAPAKMPAAAPLETPSVAPATVPVTGLQTPPVAPPQAPQQTEVSTPLPPNAPAERSEQLENIAQEADRHVRRGFELAGRQAYFAAQSEFVTALRLMAQVLDVERQTTRHSHALAAGLVAIREVDDFVPSGTRLEADLDMAAIIMNHRTPVLKDADIRTLTSLPAVKCYLTFAQEQFAVAGGQEVAGSMALYAMGKLHSALVKAKTVNICAGEPKAMAFFQAALLVFPENGLAANDLGVLLAECGHYAEARAMIEYSLAIRQHSAGWRNLAVVYQQLDLVELSRRANGQAAVTQHDELARLGGRSVAGLAVRWVDPQTFAQSFADTPTAHDPPPARSPASQTTPKSPTAARQPTPAEWPPAPLPPSAASDAHSTARAPWLSPETR